jgi:endonuclease/exonuclease/phosphatase family metal-dependent hydrolase
VSASWDDEAVKQAALDVAAGVMALQKIQRTHGKDRYLIAQARERVGELHIAYLKATGEIPRAEGPS